MKRLVLFLVTWVLMPVVRASDLTDAILDVDPRTRTTSGTGVAYHSTYGPSEESPTAAEELDPLQTPSLRGQYDYGQAYKGLRSSLYDVDQRSSLSSTEEPQTAPQDDALSTDVQQIPLGKPYEREGVWYQEDLSR